jgi:hypothetical protein
MSPRAGSVVFDPVMDASFLMAARRIGALIVIERTQSLRMYADSGKPLDREHRPGALVHGRIPSRAADGGLSHHAQRVARV